MLDIFLLKTDIEYLMSVLEKQPEEKAEALYTYLECRLEMENEDI